MSSSSSLSCHKQNNFILSRTFLSVCFGLVEGKSNQWIFSNKFFYNSWVGKEMWVVKKKTSLLFYKYRKQYFLIALMQEKRICFLFCKKKISPMIPIKLAKGKFTVPGDFQVIFFRGSVCCWWCHEDFAWFMCQLDSLDVFFEAWSGYFLLSSVVSRTKLIKKLSRYFSAQKFSSLPLSLVSLWIFYRRSLKMKEKTSTIHFAPSANRPGKFFCGKRKWLLFFSLLFDKQKAFNWN